MDTNDAWIQERTGIKERRHIKKGDGNSTSVMGVKAATIALEEANLKPDGSINHAEQCICESSLLTEEKACICNIYNEECVENHL